MGLFWRYSWVLWGWLGGVWGVFLGYHGGVLGVYGIIGDIRKWLVVAEGEVEFLDGGGDHVVGAAAVGDVSYDHSAVVDGFS